MGEIITVDCVYVPTGTHEGKTIYIASDHRGFEYKKRMKEELFRENFPKVQDLGTNSPERCDYPPISDALGMKVSESWQDSVGIGICGSGIGILIPASKHRTVYVARCLTPQEAETSRKHNNTNLLGIGADYTDFETAMETVLAWLKTPFYSDPENEQAYLMRYVQTVKLEI